MLTVFVHESTDNDFYYYKTYGRGLSLGLLVISNMSEISDCRTITCAIVYEISVFYFFK